MAIFLVNKTDLEQHPHFEEELACLCDDVSGNDKYFYFTPKPGYLSSFGLLLTEKQISYQLEFEPRSFD